MTQEKGRKYKLGPDNPGSFSQNQPFRVTATTGEKSVPVSLRVPQSKLGQVDTLGKRSDIIREAIDLLLLAREAQAAVWLLFENNRRDIPGRVLGVFSSLQIAMEVPRVQEVIGDGTWQELNPGFWVCRPSGGEDVYFSDDFYFSVERWPVDR